LAPTFFEIDERLLRVARTAGHSPARDAAVERFSRLGEHGGVWLAIGAVARFIDPERRREWHRAMRAVLFAYGLNTAIKLIVRRRRPELPDLPQMTATRTRLSFPSAHAATSLTGAVAYSRLGLPRLPLYSLAAGLSLSRLYLGVHYPSDVLAGGLLGGALGARA
jgi:membrane-associated phospholipid phosphatase